MGQKSSLEVQSRELYENLLREDGEQETAIKAIAFAVSLLQEAQQEGAIFSGIENNFEKKKIISLYSRMDKNIRGFIDKYTEQAAQEADSAKKEADRYQLCLNEKLQRLQELEQMDAGLKEENSSLLQNEIHLEQRKEEYEKIIQEYRRLEEEKKEIAGEDGAVLVCMFEKAKAINREAEQHHKENKKLNDAFDFINQILLQEKGHRLVTNIEDISGSDGQMLKEAGFEIAKMVEGLQHHFSEIAEKYQTMSQEADTLERKCQRMKKMVGSNSKLAELLKKAEIFNVQDFGQAVGEYEQKMKDGLHRYDEILGEAVENGERERNRIEQMQNMGEFYEYVEAARVGV